MLAATTDHKSHYTEQIHYEVEWTEEIPTDISWLNLLTSQSIPEETDMVESPHPQSPVRHPSESSCSSAASVESCYVVLEIQRPRSGDEASNKIDNETEQTEEVEETIVEEIEELNFAQTTHDHHDVHIDQLAISMTTQLPIEDYVVERQQEEIAPVDNYAQVTETVIFETPNDFLFQKAKTLSRFTKRMKAMSYLANKERQLSSSSDDNESIKAVKHKPIRKIHEYHPTAVLAAANKLQSYSPNQSTTSLDSIEEKTPPCDQVRVTTTFSNLSTKRVLNPIQNPRPGPTMGTTTLTRTFAFDRACMEKYGQTTENKDESIEIQVKSIDESKSHFHESTTTDRLNHRSFTNTIRTPFYIGSDRSTIDGSEIDHPVSAIPSLLIQTNNQSKTSSILSSMKKYAQTLKNEYSSPNQNNPFNEPTLLQVTYLDGRLPLRDDQARESFRQNQMLSGSIASRLNRAHSNKMCSNQDLSQTTFHMSYRKRMFNRFRAFVENNSSTSSTLPAFSSSADTRPWQHKTIAELFNERKAKSTRHN